jgi:hypothetical protein
LLDAVQTEVPAEVIAGTSAGGINGAMLAYAAGNGRALEGETDAAIRNVCERLGQIRPNQVRQSTQGLDAERRLVYIWRSFSRMVSGARGSA